MSDLVCFHLFSSVSPSFLPSPPPQVVREGIAQLSLDRLSFQARRLVGVFPWTLFSPAMASSCLFGKYHSHFMLFSLLNKIDILLYRVLMI